MPTRFDLNGGFRALDASGNASANAKIYFYEDGTTTQVTIYSDEAGTATISQPITCTSSGALPQNVYLTWRAHTVKVTDASDVELANSPIENVWPTAPNVDSEYSYATLADALADITAGVRSTGDIVMVRWYSSEGDGGGFVGVVEATADSTFPSGGRLKPIGAEVVPQMWGGKADAIYDEVNREWSADTDASNAIKNWLGFTGPAIKRLPAGNWYVTIRRINTVDGATIVFDPDAWLCAAFELDSIDGHNGLLWFEGRSGLRIPRMNLDARGMSYPAPQSSDLLTLINPVDCEIGRIFARGRFDIDAMRDRISDFRGDSAVMFTSGTRTTIGEIVADGMPDTALYANGYPNGGSLNGFDQCSVGRVVANNCYTAVAMKRGSDGLQLGTIQAKTVFYVLSSEEVGIDPPAKNWYAENVVGRDVRGFGVVARLADDSGVGHLDIEFGTRPIPAPPDPEPSSPPVPENEIPVHPLAAGTFRAACAVQGSKRFHLNSWRADFSSGGDLESPGVVPVSFTAGVIIEQRIFDGTTYFCEDVYIGSGIFREAYYGVREQQATHERTRVVSVEGVDSTGNSSTIASLQSPSSKYLAYATNNKLRSSADLHLTGPNATLAATDGLGVLQKLILNGSSIDFRHNSANIAQVGVGQLAVIGGNNLTIQPPGFLILGNAYFWVHNSEFRGSTSLPSNLATDGTLIATLT